MRRSAFVSNAASAAGSSRGCCDLVYQHRASGGRLSPPPLRCWSVCLPVCLLSAALRSLRRVLPQERATSTREVTYAGSSKFVCGPARQLIASLESWGHPEVPPSRPPPRQSPGEVPQDFHHRTPSTSHLPPSLSLSPEPAHRSLLRSTPFLPISCILHATARPREAAP